MRISQIQLGTAAILLLTLSSPAAPQTITHDYLGTWSGTASCKGTNPGSFAVVRFREDAALTFDTNCVTATTRNCTAVWTSPALGTREYYVSITAGDDANRAGTADLVSLSPPTGGVCLARRSFESRIMLLPSAGNPIKGVLIGLTPAGSVLCKVKLTRSSLSAATPFCT